MGLQLHRKSRLEEEDTQGAGDYVAHSPSGEDRHEQSGGVGALEATNNKAAAPVAAIRKEKPSRRTTSLLNIFMSNSQGKRINSLLLLDSTYYNSPQRGHKHIQFSLE